MQDEKEKKIDTPLPPPEEGEDVAATLKSLKAEKKAAEPKKKWKAGGNKFLRVLAWPFIFPFKVIQKIFNKIKLPLTVKMMIIFSFLFAGMMIGYAAFIVTSIGGRIESGTADETYLTGLIIGSTITVSLSVIVFTAFTGVISSMVLQPIRKITTDIDTITTEDLSKRIEVVDTKDELMELTLRINGMLDNIEETFTRQENFVADASHELKTPLSVVTGYANLLRRWGSKDEKVLKESVEALSRESDNMRRIVEQLLLLARLGKINTNITRFDADMVFHDMVEGYKLVNKTHSITYIGGDEIILETDRNLITVLVRVLVDNAIRYTPEGGSIIVETRLESTVFKIFVADSGMGISEEDLPKIYDRFFRCDKARGRETGGSGLGLTIAKSIADSLGGVIDVKSELGKGTIFTFTLY